MNFLQNLARYVFNSGNCFGEGHGMHLNGPIAVGEQTDIEAVIFVRDPQLSEIYNSPNGTFSFLQIVGITADEQTVTGEWNVERFAQLLAEQNPMLVTDLSRKSILNDPECAARIRKVVDAEGSSRECSWVSHLTWKAHSYLFYVTLGALSVSKFGGVLRGRLNFGRPFTLFGKKQSVHFKPSETSEISVDGDQLIIRLTPTMAAKIAADLVPKRGKFVWPELKSLVINVEPTEIWDQERTKVVSVIG